MTRKSVVCGAGAIWEAREEARGQRWYDAVDGERRVSERGQAEVFEAAEGASERRSVAHGFASRCRAEPDLSGNCPQVDIDVAPSVLIQFAPQSSSEEHRGRTEQRPIHNLEVGVREREARLRSAPSSAESHDLERTMRRHEMRRAIDRWPSVANPRRPVLGAALVGACHVGTTTGHRKDAGAECSASTVAGDLLSNRSCLTARRLCRAARYCHVKAVG